MKYLIDNGAYSIKFGPESSDPQIRQNCIGSSKREVAIAPTSLVNLTEFLRPYDRGILVDAELQLRIWRSFLPSNISSLTYTCPLYSPSTSRHLLDELIYEDLCIPEAMRVPIGHCPNCLLVDLGFSGCVVTPFYNGLPINYAVSRVTIGGKLLTNYLKEQISYRYFDMTEETWLVNIIREKMCYVPMNFVNELRGLQRKVVKELAYVLPEQGEIGFPLEDPAGVNGRQVLSLSNLAVAVPELMFRPGDAGIHCGGIQDAVLQSVELLPKEMQKELLENIVLVGGLAKTKGIVERFQEEVQENSASLVNVIKEEK